MIEVNISAHQSHFHPELLSLHRLAWCVPSARRSHIVAQLLHIFGHDVKRNSDKTLGANAGHCNIQRWRGCDASRHGLVV